MVFENNTALEKSDVEVWGNLVVSQKTLIFVLKKGDYIMLEELKEKVFKANLDLVKHNLVLFT